MRLLAIAVTVMFALFSGAAFAGKSKVAILKIDSDSGAEVQGVLKEVLTDEFGVVPFKETTKAAKSLGIDDEPTDKDFSRLTEELEVDVVVAARLEGNGETRTLRVKLYVKGKKSKKFSVQFGNAKSEKFKRTMRSTLSDKISAINRTGEDEDE
ncbi:MAG: hypothetical protein NT062_14970, partial [Proteobacteria bacterium]|nr:hypothetical protein [Pseudomonadota bacterium]